MKELKLHDGSRWEEDRVIDALDDSLRVLKGTTSHMLSVRLSDDVYDPTYAISVFADDAIAVLTRAGLNPEAERADRLVEHLERMHFSQASIARIESGDIVPEDDVTIGELQQADETRKERERADKAEAELEKLRREVFDAMLGVTNGRI